MECITIWQLFATITLLLAAEAIVPESGKANEIYYLSKRSTTTCGSPLYPLPSETRDVRRLDGIWNFRRSDQPETGYRYKWFETDLSKTGPIIPMPVPSSYNDVGQDALLRDHVGLVWYDRRFYVPSWWIKSGQRIWLRFSSAHYAADVYVNGQLVMHHEIGHLPFVSEITDFVMSNTSNLLTVVVDNMLNSETVPQGKVNQVFFNNRTILEQSYTFDFFNYAGIHRSVFLYTTPKEYINDIVVNTDVHGHTGFVMYNVTYGGINAGDAHCLVQLFNREGTQITASDECVGLLEVVDANLWWPYLMHPEPGYLYTLKVSLIGEMGEIVDSYLQEIGIRTVHWNATNLMINDKPIYFRGFGMHEDSDLRGKGWDPVLWVKNFNLIKWLGANAFRTSHYPYAEEIYQLADRHGIMIVDECPSGDTDFFTDALLKKHKQSLTELIRRDKNHPSVVMWSVANEPRSAKPAADAYFKSIVAHVKSMDTSRPVTAAISQGYYADLASQYMDVVGFNRYNAWYHDDGKLYTILKYVVDEAVNWYTRFKKPVLMFEYGADTLAGYHSNPVYIWSEEFQVAVLSEHFKAFDKLRRDGFFVGEFIWNFADFNTQQTYTRVGGNKKGLFTRQRQPKSSAHHVRQRYHALAAAEVGIRPLDLGYYVSENFSPSNDETLLIESTV